MSELPASYDAWRTASGWDEDEDEDEDEDDDPRNEYDPTRYIDGNEPYAVWAVRGS